MQIKIPFSSLRLYLFGYGRALLIARERRLSPTCYASEMVWVSGWGRIKGGGKFL